MRQSNGSAFCGCDKAFAVAGGGCNATSSVAVDGGGGGVKGLVAGEGVVDTDGGKLCLWSGETAAAASSADEAVTTAADGWRRSVPAGDAPTSEVALAESAGLWPMTGDGEPIAVVCAVEAVFFREGDKSRDRMEVEDEE